jgi:hypothetical protein
MKEHLVRTVNRRPKKVFSEAYYCQTATGTRQGEYSKTKQEKSVQPYFREPPLTNSKVLSRNITS